MWVDRLTGQHIDRLPDVIESGRYLAELMAGDSSSLSVAASGLLVDDGSEIANVGGERKSFRLPDKAIAQKSELFERILDTIDSSIESETELASPLMPEGVVDDDSHLNSFDLKLMEIIGAGHLRRKPMPGAWEYTKHENVKA